MVAFKFEFIPFFFSTATNPSYKVSVGMNGNKNCSFTITHCNASFNQAFPAYPDTSFKHLIYYSGCSLVFFLFFFYL